MGREVWTQTSLHPKVDMVTAHLRFSRNSCYTCYGYLQWTAIFLVGGVGSQSPFLVSYFTNWSLVPSLMSHLTTPIPLVLNVWLNCEYLVRMYHATCLETISSLGKWPSMLRIFGKQNSLLFLGSILLSFPTLNQDIFLYSKPHYNRWPCKFEMNCIEKKRLICAILIWLP